MQVCVWEGEGVRSDGGRVEVMMGVLVDVYIRLQCR